MPEARIIEWIREKYTAVIRDLAERGVGDGLLLKHAPLAGVAFPRSRRQPVFQIARSELEFVSLMIRARQLLTGKESLVADDGDVKTNSLS